MATSTESGGVISWVVTAIFLLMLALAAREQMEAHGLLAHSRETPVRFASDWVLGEVRECSALPHQDGALEDLDCGNLGENERFHRMVVEYWGRLQRPEKVSLGTPWMS